MINNQNTIFSYLICKEFIDNIKQFGKNKLLDTDYLNSDRNVLFKPFHFYHFHVKIINTKKILFFLSLNLKIKIKKQLYNCYYIKIINHDYIYFVFIFIFIFFVSKLMNGFPFIEYLCNLNNLKNVFFSSKF
jgi:hypothetical protein